MPSIFDKMMNSSKRKSNEQIIEEFPFKCTICFDRFDAYKKVCSHYNAKHRRHGRNFDAHLDLEVTPRDGRVLSEEHENWICPTPQKRWTKEEMDAQSRINGDQDKTFFSMEEKILLVRGYFSDSNPGRKKEFIREHNLYNERQIDRFKLRRWKQQVQTREASN